MLRKSMFAIIIKALGLAFATLVFSLWGTEYESEQSTFLNFITLTAMGILLVVIALAKTKLPLEKNTIKFSLWLKLVALPVFSSLTFLLPLLGNNLYILCVAIALFGSLGMIPLVTAYTEELSRLTAKNTVITVGTALIINHLLHILIQLVPYALALVIKFSLPLLASLCLFLQTKQASATRSAMNAMNTNSANNVRTSTTAEEHLDLKPAYRHLGRFVGATAAINLAISFMYVFYRAHGTIASSEVVLDTVTMLARVMLLLVVVVMFFLIKQFKVVNLYRILVVLSIFAFLTFPLLGAESVIPYTLSAVAFTCLGILMWVFPARICALNKQLQPSLCIGVCYGPFVALWAASYLIGRNIVIPYELTMSVLNTITFCGIALVVIAYTFIFNEKNMIVATPAHEDMRKLGARKMIDGAHVASIASLYGLTAREQEIMQLIFNNQSRAQIQNKLFISEGTLNSHTGNIYKKMGVHNRQELVAKIRQNAFS